jgi:hypothetical protein
MIEVNGIQLDFDITSPVDVQRYKEALEQMDEDGKQISLPTLKSDDPKFLDAYTDMLNAELQLYGNFLDDLFGDGVAEQLLGNKPSLRKIAEIDDAVGSAIAAQGDAFGLSLQKYKPNRAARRQQQSKKR